METATSRTSPLKILQSVGVHHDLDFLFDHWIKSAVKQGLGSLFLDIEDLFYHRGDLLLTYLEHILACVLFNIVQVLVSHWVHVQLQPSDVLIVCDGLHKQSGSFISNHVVPHIDLSNLDVLFEQLNKR